MTAETRRAAGEAGSARPGDTRRRPSGPCWRPTSTSSAPPRSPSCARPVRYPTEVLQDAGVPPVAGIVRRAGLPGRRLRPLAGIAGRRRPGADGPRHHVGRGQGVRAQRRPVTGLGAASPVDHRRPLRRPLGAFASPLRRGRASRPWAVLLMGSLGGWVQPAPATVRSSKNRQPVRAGERVAPGWPPDGSAAGPRPRRAAVHVVAAVVPHTHHVHVATAVTWPRPGASCPRPSMRGPYSLRDGRPPAGDRRRRGRDGRGGPGSPPGAGPGDRGARDGRWTSYSACGIPYVVGGSVHGLEDLVARTPDEFRAMRIDVRTEHEVIGLDLAARKVEVHNRAHGRTFQLGFDQLHVATGARPRRPDLPGMDLPARARRADPGRRRRLCSTVLEGPPRPGTWSWSAAATSGWRWPRRSSSGGRR